MTLDKKIDEIMGYVYVLLWFEPQKVNTNLANGYPLNEGHTPRSIVYEQVEKDLEKWLKDSHAE